MEGHHHHHHHGEGGGAYPQYPQGGGGAYPQGGGGYPQAGMGRREFLIVSELNGKVVDIKGAHAAAGAEVLTYHKKSPPAKNQLWYLDPQGFIRSALNEMVFHNATKGHGLKTENSTGDPRSQWRPEGNKIVNMAGECLDIRGASNSDGAEVCAYDYKNQKNQHWMLEYV